MDTARRRPLKVGLFPTQFQFPGTDWMPSWADFAQLAKRAEEAGFDSFWLGDHPFVRMPEWGDIPTWDGLSVLTALAATTSKIELGTLVACTGFRNPSMLAKMSITIDEISGGRLILGLGAGWHDTDFKATGHAFDHRGSRFEEAMTIISALVKQGQVNFAGTYYQAQNAFLAPRGPRPNGIPIVIGSQGPRMTKLAARYANAWNRDFTPKNAIAELGDWKTLVDAACEEIGRDPASLERFAGVLIDLPGASREGWGALTGSAEELADALRAYADAGFSHVQVWIEPSTLASVDTFAETLALLDAG